MIVLDTSTLIRLFTKDDPKKEKKALKLVESSQQLYIPEAVLPEIEYVLGSKIYNYNREDIVKVFQFLNSKDNVNMTRQAKQAVIIYSTEDLDMADCLIASYSLENQLASFDKNLLKIPGVKSYF